MFNCVGAPLNLVPEQTDSRGSSTFRTETPRNPNDKKGERSIHHYFPRILSGQRKSNHRSSSSISSLESLESAHNASRGDVNRDSRSVRYSEHSAGQSPVSAMQTRKALGKLVEPKTAPNSSPPATSIDSHNRLQSRSEQVHASLNGLHSHHEPPTGKARRAKVIPSEILPPPNLQSQVRIQRGNELNALHSHRKRNPEEEELTDRYQRVEDGEEESSSYTTLPPLELLDKLLEEGLKLKGKYKQLKIAYQTLQEQSHQQQVQARERYQQLQSTQETQLREYRTKAYLDLASLKDTHQQEISQLYMKINLLDNNLIYLTNEKNDLLIQQHQLLQEKERWKLAATSSQSPSGGSGETFSYRGLLGIEGKDTISQELEVLKLERVTMLEIIEAMLTKVRSNGKNVGEANEETEEKPLQDSITSKLQILHQFVTTTQENHQQLRYDHQLLKSSYDEAVHQWTKEKTSLAEAVEEYRLRYETILQEKESLTQDQVGIQEEKEMLIMKVKTLEAQLAAENEKSKLQTELQQAKTQIDELQRLLEEVIQSKEAIENHIHGLVEENERLQQQLLHNAREGKRKEEEEKATSTGWFRSSTSPTSRGNHSLSQPPSHRRRSPENYELQPFQPPSSTWSHHWKGDDPSVIIANQHHRSGHRYFSPHRERVRDRKERYNTSMNRTAVRGADSRDTSGGESYQSSYSRTTSNKDPNNHSGSSSTVVSIHEIETSSGRKKFELLKQKFEDLSR